MSPLSSSIVSSKGAAKGGDLVAQATTKIHTKAQVWHNSFHTLATHVSSNEDLAHANAKRNAANEVTIETHKDNCVRREATKHLNKANGCSGIARNSFKHNHCHMHKLQPKHKIATCMLLFPVVVVKHCLPTGSAHCSASSLVLLLLQRQR